MMLKNIHDELVKPPEDCNSIACTFTSVSTATPGHVHKVHRKVDACARALRPGRRSRQPGRCRIFSLTGAHPRQFEHFFLRSKPLRYGTLCKYSPFQQLTKQRRLPSVYKTDTDQLYNTQQIFRALIGIDQVRPSQQRFW